MFIRIVNFIFAALPLIAHAQSANPPHLVIAPGMTETVAFQATPGASLQMTWPDQTKEKIEIKPDQTGNTSLLLRVPESMETGELRLLLQDATQEATVVADIIDREQYRKLDTIASSIHLSKPMRILVLGDSLTAQLAGSNQIDKLQFWLKKHNPGMIQFRNAAVGGDSIRLVSRRLKHLLDPATQKPQFRQESYDDLFDFQPDLVFIALGQNDTKVTSQSNYQETMLSPEEWQRYFAETVDILEKYTKAQVVLISSISPVEEICKQRAGARAKEGRVHLLYGQPQAMENFNAFLKAFGEKRGLEFCDFYTPTKNHPNKVSLFQPADGLHLTADGNRFLAQLYLQYFAAHFR